LSIFLRYYIDSSSSAMVIAVCYTTLCIFLSGMQSHMHNWNIICKNLILKLLLLANAGFAIAVDDTIIPTKKLSMIKHIVASHY
jgi:hypothetical protein